LLCRCRWARQGEHVVAHATHERGVLAKNQDRNKSSTNHAQRALCARATQQETFWLNHTSTSGNNTGTIFFTGLLGFRMPQSGKTNNGTKVETQNRGTTAETAQKDPPPCGSGNMHTQDALLFATDTTVNPGHNAIFKTKQQLEPTKGAADIQHLNTHRETEFGAGSLRVTLRWQVSTTTAPERTLKRQQRAIRKRRRSRSVKRDHVDNRWGRARRVFIARQQLALLSRRL